MRPVSVVVGVVLSVLAVLTVAGLVRAGTAAWSDIFDQAFNTAPSLHAAARVVWQGLLDSVLTPWYWGFIAALVVLQWRFPGRRDQAPPSTELAVDGVWFLMNNVAQITVVALVLGAESVAYQALTGGWSLDLEPHLGLAGIAVLGFVAADVTTWIAHWAHHKTPTLWRLHQVHHSQLNLNSLADNRQHVGETIVSALLVFVPLQACGMSADAAVTLTFLANYWCAFIHSNLHTNLGPLKWVFISPQAHRIHHSRLPQHFDSNFGSVFSWWDYLAGTMYRGYDEYPPTGIGDADFPVEQRSANPARWVAAWVSQTVYPFKAILSPSPQVAGRPVTVVATRTLEEPARPERAPIGLAHLARITALPAHAGPHRAAVPRPGAPGSPWPFVSTSARGVAGPPRRRLEPVSAHAGTAEWLGGDTRPPGTLSQRLAAARAQGSE